MTRSNLKSIIAYLVYVGSKPVPYVFAAIVAGLFIEHFEETGALITSVVRTVLVSSGLALLVLPPLLHLRSWATKNRKDEVRLWPWACGASIALLTAWACWIVD